jgi:acetyl esterase/lipase
MWCALVLLALSAALSAAAQDTATVPPPGSTPMRIEIQAADGVTLVGDLYNAELNVQTPAVLLMHMYNGQRGDWRSLIPALTAQGFRVVNVDLRGHGDSSGKRDWQAAVTDVQAWLDWMHSQPSIVPEKIAIVGGSVGANLALVGCANDTDCVTAVALSPGLDYFGITTSEAVEPGLRQRSALILASRGDNPSGKDVVELLARGRGDLDVHLYAGSRHGTNLLLNPSVPGEIVAWLNGHLR